MTEDDVFGRGWKMAPANTLDELARERGWAVFGTDSVWHTMQAIHDGTLRKLNVVYMQEDPERARVMFDWSQFTHNEVIYYKCGHFCMVRRLGACCDCAKVKKGCGLCRAGDLL